MANANMVRSWRFRKVTLAIVAAVLFVCLAFEAAQCISTKTIIGAEQVSNK